MNLGGEAPGLAHMDAANFKSKMHSLAYGNVMAQAAKDYQQEMMATAAAGGEGQSHGRLDMDDLMHDPDLEALHRDRLMEMQREAEKRQVMQRKGHGEYQEVAEADFLEAVTQTQQVVVHFFHRDFTRCKIVDKHLAELTRKFFKTRFIKISAPDAPFFTEKLQIQMLPCIVLFLGGVAVDRITGFEELGGKDDFKVGSLERRLVAAGVADLPMRREVDSDGEEPEQLRSVVRRSGGNLQKGSDDEDSDFD